MAEAQKGWFLPFEAVNSIQADTINRLIRRAKGAHWADVRMRINGEFEHFEADWIKHMVPVTGQRRMTATEVLARQFPNGASVDTPEGGA